MIANFPEPQFHNNAINCIYQNKINKTNKFINVLALLCHLNKTKCETNNIYIIYFKCNYNNNSKDSSVANAKRQMLLNSLRESVWFQQNNV